MSSLRTTEAANDTVPNRWLSVQGAISQLARREAVFLTNNSGATVSAGDVVMFDPSTPGSLSDWDYTTPGQTVGSFVTTTTAGATGMVGVVLRGATDEDTIADGDAGYVSFVGFVQPVNVGGATVGLGDYAYTSSVAGEATSSPDLSEGAFGIFLNTVDPPAAFLFGAPTNLASGAGDDAATDFIAAAVSNPPTQAEIETALGSPGAVPAGTVIGLQDSGTTKRYLALSDGVQWHIVPLVVPLEGATAALTTAPAGGWAQTHAAAYYNGKTYFAYVRGDNGNIELRTYTHSTGVTSSAKVLRASLSNDLHSSPSLAVRQSDHRIHVFYSDHAGAAMYQWISTNPEDITTGTETNIDSQLGGSGYTYPMVADLDSGLYLFVRPYGGAGAGQIWSYSVTTDNGTTWSALTDYYQVTGGQAYPFLQKTGANRVDFIAIDDTSLATDQSIQFFSWNAGSDIWTAADGTGLTLPIGDQSEIVVWDGSTLDDARGRMDVRRGLDVHPRLLFGSINGSTLTYRHARWTGSTWVITALSSGSEPVAASARFDSLNTNRLWLSDSSNEIVELTTLDESTWSSAARTSATTSIYPISPEDHAPDLPVAWGQGSYTDAATYSVNIEAFGTDDAAAAAAYLQRLVFLDDTALDELIVKRTPTGQWQFSRDDGANWENAGGAAALDDLSDVTITSPATANLLRYNGSVWANASLSQSDLPGHYEILMASGSADPLLTSDGLDYLYVWRPD